MERLNLPAAAGICDDTESELLLDSDKLPESDDAQRVMPLFPHGTTHINNLLAFSCEEGTVTYFNGSMPLFSHRETDVASFHLIIAQFYLNGHVKPADFCRAFGMTAISVKRAVKLHREQASRASLSPAKGVARWY